MLYFVYPPSHSPKSYLLEPKRPIGVDRPFFERGFTEVKGSERNHRANLCIRLNTHFCPFLLNCFCMSKPWACLIKFVGARAFRDSIIIIRIHCDVMLQWTVFEYLVLSFITALYQLDGYKRVYHYKCLATVLVYINVLRVHCRPVLIGPSLCSWMRYKCHSISF